MLKKHKLCGLVNRTKLHSLTESHLAILSPQGPKKLLILNIITNGHITLNQPVVLINRDLLGLKHG